MYALTRHGGLILIVGLLMACGSEAPSPLNAPPASTSTASAPQAVFEQMRALYLASDWEGLYELNAPSERDEVETAWRTALASDTSKSVVDDFAKETGLAAERVREMTFREVVVARDVTKAKRSSQAKDRVRGATFVGVKDRKDDTVMVTMRVNEREQDLPMKREGGRWYLWRRLTAIANFDN